MPELQSASSDLMTRIWEYLAEHPEDAEAWEKAQGGTDASPSAA